MLPIQAPSPPSSVGRITSIDALRGLVMFLMIFVNDLAEAPKEIVPWWMRHFQADGNGMTFVDLVFPAFLFIVGMSVPFGLGSRLAKGESLLRIGWHILGRTLALLTIGVLMVNESPDLSRMGWSPALWSTLMHFFAILAFCSFSNHRYLSAVTRYMGILALVALAFAFRGADGQRIVSLAPFVINTQWWGILGLIAWAYLMGAIAFLCFRTNRTALLGCVVLLMSLYVADRHGTFQHFWLNRYVGVGGTLGSQAAITVAGALLASILLTPDTASVRHRLRFTILFIAGFAAAALLLHGLYGINKNSATPAWCLWACAITASVWLGFYCICDVRPMPRLTKVFAISGENVLLAYLISEMWPSTVDLMGLGGWYSRLAEPNLACAIARSGGLAVLILATAARLNRSGFWLRL